VIQFAAPDRRTESKLAMVLIACALLFELCLAAVLWRVSSQRPTIATSIASFFICLAAACCIGLATQGLFLLAADVLQVSELPPTIFWLVSGLFAFAVALATKPSPVFVALPCLIVALCSFTFSFLRDDAMMAVVGLVLSSTALPVWYHAGRVRRRAGKAVDRA